MSFTYITHGTGTELDPYLIENAEGLKELFASTEDYTEAYFKQTADIAVNDVSNYDSWTTQTPSYRQPARPAAGGIGYYDGDNHSITGLFYNDNSYNDNDHHCLLFYYVKHKISNLVIKKSMMRRTSVKTLASLLTAECPYIENIKSEADFYFNDTSNSLKSPRTISVFNNTIYNGNLYRQDSSSFYAADCVYTGNIFIKGIALEFALFNILFSSRATGIEITGCANEGSITIEDWAVAHSGNGPLRLCGIAIVDASNKPCIISECYNKMDFIVDPDEILDSECNVNLAGIVFAKNINSQSSIRDCYNAGQLQTFLNNSGWLGLYGIAEGLNITNCYNYGITSFSGDSTPTDIYAIGRNADSSNKYLQGAVDFTTADNSVAVAESDFNDPASFSGWDFTETWTLNNLDRPQLRNNLEIVRYTLTLNRNYSTYGTVSGAGQYLPGASVTLTATPAEGYYFVRWHDGNTNATRTITMPENNVSYTAGFGHSLTVLSDDDTMGTVTGTSLHCPGETQQIAAIPESGYKFSRWNDDNTDNPRTVWAGSSNDTYTAYFEAAESYTVEITSNYPAMGTVTGSGTYDEGTSVTLTATAEEGYHFVQWDDENTDNPRTIIVNDDIIMEAQFAANVVIPEHTLSLAVNYSIMGELSGDGTYPEDSSVEISATANTVYVFVRWQDGNTDNPRTISMPHEDTEYTAYFGYVVTGESEDNESGTVSGSGNYVPGDNAMLTASPANGYLFDKWDNNSTINPLILTVSGNITRTASFVEARTIQLVSADDTMGIVTLDPNDTTASSGVVKDGSVINVYAVAKPDYRFVEWADGETANPRTITVTEDIELTAEFEEVTYYNITVNVNEAGRGVVYGGGTYADNNTVAITAQANQGYRFIAWDDGNTSATRTVIMDEDKSFTAIFEEVFSREIDLSKYRGKLGRIRSRGSLYTTLTVIKSLMSANNYCTEIGQFDTQTGKHFVFVSVKNPATFSCKQYSLALNHNHTSGDWFIAEPIDESDEQDETYRLEVKSDGVSAAIRLKYLTSNNNGENLDYQIVIQNLGLEDENWYEGSANYVDDTTVAGVISSIPSGSATGNDHMHLANRGNHTHAEIDEHLDSPNPHSGHELTSNKNVANGYAGLDENAKIDPSQILFGDAANTVTEGNDPRLSNARYPTAHASSHNRGGNDPLFLMNLSGNLAQSRSHDNADTDASVEAIHHTLGSASTQAAPGNHLHDERYAPIAEGVDGGNQHTHDGVNTAAVDHEDLLNKGIYPHSDIDTHLEATNPHSGHENKANKDVVNGYAGLNALGKLKSEEIDFGTGAGTVCEGNDPRLTNARPPSAHASYHSAGSSDPITISDLDGNLTQARSHASADTDTGASSIHHTLGSSANQAAPGNHNHDATYAPISMLLADNDNLGPNLTVSNTQDGYVLSTEAITVTTETGETDPNTGDPITTSETVLKTRMRRLAHSDLGEIGIYDHDDIDQFINNATQYEVTVNRGQANGYATLDANGRIPLSQMPSSATSLVPNVANIAARNALTNVADGAQVRVLDASADQSVGSGWALYVYDAANDQWVKLAEQEGLDFTTEWSNIQNKPVSTAVELDTAVTKTHDQNTDTELDHGGTNEISAAAIKTHIGAQNPHSGHESTSNKGIAGGYASLDLNGKVPLAQLPSGIAASSASTADEAAHATTADTADYATAAGSATTATSATTAGSAATADALTSPFTLSLSGHAEGSASIDGSNNVTLNVTIPALAGSTFSLMSAEEVEEIIV